MGLFSGLTDFLKTTVQTVGATAVGLANSSLGNTVANALIKKQLGVDVSASSPVVNGSVNPGTTAPGFSSSPQGDNKEGDGLKTPIMSKLKRFFNPYKIDEQGFFELKDGKKQLSFFKICLYIIIPSVVILFFWLLSKPKKRKFKRYNRFRKYGSR